MSYKIWIVNYLFILNIHFVLFQFYFEAEFEKRLKLGEHGYSKSQVLGLIFKSSQKFLGPIITVGSRKNGSTFSTRGVFRLFQILSDLVQIGDYVP